MKIDVLRKEISTDPLARGYSGMTDKQIVDSLNAVGRSKDRVQVPGHEIFAAIRPADFLAVFGVAGDAAHQEYLRIMFQLDSVPLDNAGVRTALTTIFAGRTGTLSDLAALQSTSVSRAQELGLGTVLLGWVADARKA